MRKQFIIKKLISSFFICLLALSITPKVILHTIVANHKDGFKSAKSINNPQLSKAGFNCHYDNLVAESPFITAAVIAPGFIPLLYASLEVYVESFFYTFHHFYAALRGPPTA